MIPAIRRPSEDTSRAAHIDELLDEALKATFPASDPVAHGLTLSAGTADTLYTHRGEPGLLCDRPVLLGDESGSGSIPLCATQYLTWNPAIGPLRTVHIKDVEQHEFSTSAR